MGIPFQRPACCWAQSFQCTAQARELPCRLMKMKPRGAGPPDGGYGWVVVMSAFFIMGLTAGVLKNFGLFFLDIQNHYGVPTSTISWVTSSTIAMFHLGGKSFIYLFLFFFVNWFKLKCFITILRFFSPSAPLASVLALLFSQRVVIIVGGLMAASGMLLASLDLNLPWLYLTLGILQGSTLETCLEAVSLWLSVFFSLGNKLIFLFSGGFTIHLRGHELINEAFSHYLNLKVVLNVFQTSTKLQGIIIK